MSFKSFDQIWWYSNSAIRMINATFRNILGYFGKAWCSYHTVFCQARSYTLKCVYRSRRVSDHVGFAIVYSFLFYCFFVFFSFFFPFGLFVVILLFCEKHYVLHRLQTKLINATSHCRHEKSRRGHLFHPFLTFHISNPVIPMFIIFADLKRREKQHFIIYIWLLYAVNWY